MIQSHSVTSGSIRLATFVAGHGEPVVFVHANVCDSRMWLEQFRSTGRKRMAIAYDRCGFGMTPADQQDHSPVADLIAVIDATAETRPVTLVACSIVGGGENPRISGADVDLEPLTRTTAMLLLG